MGLRRTLYSDKREKMLVDDYSVTGNGSLQFVKGTYLDISKPGETRYSLFLFLQRKLEASYFRKIRGQGP